MQGPSVWSSCKRRMTRRQQITFSFYRVDHIGNKLDSNDILELEGECWITFIFILSCVYYYIETDDSDWYLIA